MTGPVGRDDPFRDDIFRTGAGASRPVDPNIDIIQRVRQKLQEISSSQEELAEAREQILIEREKLISSRKDVHHQRVVTGDAEVAFMDALRAFFNKHAHSFPPELTDSYQKVLDERDKLGVLEEDHLQAGRNLGASEWAFHEQEEDFYQLDLQNLLSDALLDGSLDAVDADQHHSPPGAEPIIPSPPMQYQAATVEWKRLKARFNDLRRDRARYILVPESLCFREPDPGDPKVTGTEFVSLYTELLSQIMDCEVRIHNLKPELPHWESMTNTKPRRHSEPSNYYHGIYQASEAPSRAHSDNQAWLTSGELPTQTRMRDWLLECLQNNAIEKLVYLSILEGAMGIHRDILAWEELAIKYWRFDRTDKVLEGDPNYDPSPYNSSQAGDGLDESQQDDIAKMTTEGSIDDTENFNEAVDDEAAALKLPNILRSPYQPPKDGHLNESEPLPGHMQSLPVDIRITEVITSSPTDRAGNTHEARSNSNFVDHPQGALARRYDPMDFLGAQFPDKIDSAYNSDVEELPSAQWAASTSTRVNDVSFSSVKGSTDASSTSAPLAANYSDVQGMQSLPVVPATDDHPENMAFAMSVQERMPPLPYTPPVCHRNLTRHRSRSAACTAETNNRTVDASGSTEGGMRRNGNNATDRLAVPSVWSRPRAASTPDAFRYKIIKSCGQEDNSSRSSGSIASTHSFRIPIAFT